MASVRPPALRRADEGGCTAWRRHDVMRRRVELRLAAPTPRPYMPGTAHAACRSAASTRTRVVQALWQAAWVQLQLKASPVVVHEQHLRRPQPAGCRAGGAGGCRGPQGAHLRDRCGRPAGLFGMREVQLAGAMRSRVRPGWHARALTCAAQQQLLLHLQPVGAGVRLLVQARRYVHAAKRATHVGVSDTGRLLCRVWWCSLAGRGSSVGGARVAYAAQGCVPLVRHTWHVSCCPGSRQIRAVDA